jgi:hypothetical protein
VPLLASVPLQAPEAVQPLDGALLTLHVSVMICPVVVAVGVALMLITGVAVFMASVVTVLVVAVDAPSPPPHAVNARDSRALAR